MNFIEKITGHMKTRTKFEIRHKLVTFFTEKRWQQRKVETITRIIRMGRRGIEMKSEGKVFTPAGNFKTKH